MDNSGVTEEMRAGGRQLSTEKRFASFCPEECGKVIHPLQHGLRQVLYRESELYGWVDRKRHDKAACLGPPMHSLPEARCQPWQRSWSLPACLYLMETGMLSHKAGDACDKPGALAVSGSHSNRMLLLLFCTTTSETLVLSHS